MFSYCGRALQEVKTMTEREFIEAVRSLDQKAMARFIDLLDQEGLLPDREGCETSRASHAEPTEKP